VFVFWGFLFCLGVFFLFSVSCKEGSLSTPDQAGFSRNGRRARGCRDAGVHGEAERETEGPLADIC
jgi:hypothetical protein